MKRLVICFAASFVLCFAGDRLFVSASLGTAWAIACAVAAGLMF